MDAKELCKENDVLSKEFNLTKSIGYIMDISGVQTAAIASSVSQNDPAGIAVLKKTMDIQKQSAMQLIQSIPQLPDNLGQNINVKV